MISFRRSLRRPTTAQPERLRVAIVAESFLPAVNGVTNSVLRLLEHLAAEGHEALVIAPGPGDTVVHGTPVVRVRSVDLPRYDSLRVGLPVGRLTSTLRDFAPDVVHLAAPTVLGAGAARAARNLDIPVVAIFQTDIVGFAKRYGAGAASAPLWSWLRWIHSHADITLAPSTAAAWTLKANGIERVDRWVRGVDLQRFNPTHRNPMLHRHMAPNGEVVVGFVGRLAKEKQIHRLASASRLAGVRVVIVGDGPERAKLERQLPRATFVGFKSGHELSQFHASFDIFAHTGLDETFCQSVQEALASAVPVVAPAAGGPLDLVTHGHNGYLWSPEQPEMLVGAIATLAESSSMRAAMGRNGRMGVESRPWVVVMDELIGRYRSVIAGEPFQPAAVTSISAATSSSASPLESVA
jgi:phosphatidylinositol alpha 1,6-mannosyltransferase